MMLTVCVPVYNFEVNDLVSELARQITADELDAEIVLIDDASTKEFVEKNKPVASQIRQFIFLPANIGRSRIRNLFLKYSQSDYLLFLDCDGKIANQHFIKTYLDYIQSHRPDVIYGGRQVEARKPDPEYGLRWKFAVERENLPVNERVTSPYLHFQTNNFVVKRSVLEAHPFDESIIQYGYEDLIFAKDLSKSGVRIHHIGNPVFNNDVETNEIFLQKADESAKSLAQLITTENFKEDNDIKLAKAYFFLKKYGLLIPFSTFYRIIKAIIEKKLLSGSASLRYLDFYKLGQMVRYVRKH